MRRVSLCVFAMAILACVLPTLASADLMIEAETASAFQNATVRTGQSAASGSQDVQLNFPWDVRGSAFFWLDSGAITPGTYNLTLSLFSDANPARSASAELRAGTHLTDDGSWLSDPGAYALPTALAGYESLVCKENSDYTGNSTVFTIASGQDYTLRVHAYGADMSYFDKLTFNTLAEVPEPSVLVLLSAGLLGLLAYAWRRRR